MKEIDNLNLIVKQLKNHSLYKNNSYSHFKQSILERDHYICQVCKKEDRDNRVHHILHVKKYPELRYEEEVCITLCTICHRSFHVHYPGIDITFSDFIAFYFDHSRIYLRSREALLKINDTMFLTP